MLSIGFEWRRARLWNKVTVARTCGGAGPVGVSPLVLLSVADRSIVSGGGGAGLVGVVVTRLRR